jgi:hypothetical protein
MKILVHIDRLVLEGLPASVDKRRVSAAIQHELPRYLLRVATECWRGGVFESMTVPFSPLLPAPRPDTIGLGIARAAGFAIASSQTVHQESTSWDVGGEHR